MPHVAREHLARDDTPPMAQQKLEDVELLRGQFERLRSPRDLARHEIHFEIVVLELQDLVHPPAAKQCADSREQLGEGERLDQVIVGAAVQSLHPVLDSVFRREDEYWRLNPALAQRVQNVETVPPRKPQIEQQQVKRALAR